MRANATKNKEYNDSMDKEEEETNERTNRQLLRLYHTDGVGAYGRRT